MPIRTQTIELILSALDGFDNDQPFTIRLSDSIYSADAIEDARVAFKDILQVEVSPADAGSFISVRIVPLNRVATPKGAIGEFLNYVLNAETARRHRATQSRG